jgi:glycolate oxidase FAD binding subunit
VVTTTQLSIDGIAVGSRLTPGSAEELASALQAANGAGQAVAPVGGGTQLDLGMPPSTVDLVLETTRLNKVVEYEPADLTVTVEAGVRFADLQKLLAEQGQFLALDPPLQSDATIGGVIATNASGPMRFAFGTARDLVLGTRVANPDGTLTHAGGRVVKNVAGYDLNKLYIGSLGTLGIIVELSFKLAPIPASSATIVAQFSELNAAQPLIGAVVRSPLSAMAIELVGPGASAAARLLPANHVLFRVGGYPQAVQRQVRDLSALLTEHGGQRVDAPDTLWADLGASRVEAQRRDVVLKAAAPIAESTKLLNFLESRLGASNPFVWAHAGNGVAYAACDTPPLPSVLTDLRREIAKLGSNASLVIQRCPTELKRSIDVWGDPGPSLALMRALKTKLDPKSTLNPGRYVGGI